MKITAITRQAKRADRYSIYVDGQFSFGLGEAQLLQLGIQRGMELDDKKLSEFRAESEKGKVYEKILNLLSYRLRSEWELRDYLKRKKQPTALADEILNKLRKNGYIDDQRFAERWIQNRRLLKPISTRKLRQELLQKRIDHTVIDKALARDDVDELDALRQLVERKQRQYPDKQKFMAFLARRGYNYEDIKTVLAEEPLS